MIGNGRVAVFLRLFCVVIPNGVLTKNFTQIVRVYRWIRSKQAKTQSSPDTDNQTQNRKPVPFYAGLPQVAAGLALSFMWTCWPPEFSYQTVISGTHGLLAQGRVRVS